MPYILYRSSIYISFTIVNPRGDSMLKKKLYKDSEENEDDISIYTKDVRESLLEDDELSPMEEAFMNGYEDAA